MELIFDETEHRYFHGELELPSVTRILKDEGYIDDQWYTPGATKRGTYVHKICYLHNINDLDKSTVDPSLEGYYAAYQQFLTESGFIVEDAELQVHSDTYLYAGTLDIRGRFPMSRLPAVIDIKSGVVSPWVALQLASYVVCLPEPHERFSLQLADNGKYHLQEYKDRIDQIVFLGAVAAWRWKNAHLKRRGN